MRMIPYTLLLIIVAFETGGMHTSHGVILYISIILFVTLSCTFEVKHSKAKVELWLSAVNWIRANNEMWFETRDLLGNSIVNDPKCCPPPYERDIVLASCHTKSRDYTVLSDVRVQERDKSLEVVEISFEGVTYLMKKSQLLDLYVRNGLSRVSTTRRVGFHTIQLILQLFWGALALLLTIEGSFSGLAMVMTGINFRWYFEKELSAFLAQNVLGGDWNDVVKDLPEKLSPNHRKS